MKLLIRILPGLIILLFLNASPCASQLSDNQEKTVKIGLLIPDNKSIAARQGAEMAIREANENKTPDEMTFQLVTRSMEGPWGTGSKEAINLIFEEKVWAIMGSHDGRNAHLVEQACTKAHVVFLSAWSTDPTLSQAFVPWFFNCVPNDIQQADALIEEIYNKRRIDKIAVVAGNDYDSKLSSETFLKRTKFSAKTDPLMFSFDNSTQDLIALPDRIIKSDVKCIILFCRPYASFQIIKQIRQREIKQLLFGSTSLINENELSGQELQFFDNLLIVSSAGWPALKSSTFRQDYLRLYGKPPGMVASYAYDGMNLLIEAIKDAGVPEREIIQKSLEKIQYQGVTGSIRFDNKGNRTGGFIVTCIKNGLPAAIEKNNSLNYTNTLK